MTFTFKLLIFSLSKPTSSAFSLAYFSLISRGIIPLLAIT